MISLTRKRNIGYLLKTHTRANIFSTKNKLPEICKNIEKDLKILNVNIKTSHDLNIDKEKIIRSLDEIQNNLTIIKEKIPLLMQEELCETYIILYASIICCLVLPIAIIEMLC